MPTLPISSADSCVTPNANRSPLAVRSPPPPVDALGDSPPSADALGDSPPSALAEGDVPPPPPDALVAGDWFCPPPQPEASRIAARLIADSDKGRDFMGRPSSKHRPGSIEP